MSAFKKILLADDDADDQQFFLEALNETGNTILYGVANNGREAFDMLKNSVSLPDIIFLDFNMPVMNGIECLTEIIKFNRTKDIPVIMLSSAIEQAETCHKAGAKGFIKKTFDITALRADLHRIINPRVTQGLL